MEMTEEEIQADIQEIKQTCEVLQKAFQVIDRTFFAENMQLAKVFQISDAHQYTSFKGYVDHESATREGAKELMHTILFVRDHTNKLMLNEFEKRFGKYES